jgi:hypothetical protein
MKPVEDIFWFLGLNFVNGMKRAKISKKEKKNVFINLSILSGLNFF